MRFTGLLLSLVILLTSPAFAAETIRVGASPFPHAEILEVIKPLVEKEGYKLEIIQFSDYIQPNIALADKSLDANFMQHVPHLKAVSDKRGFDLIWVAKVHIEPLGLYSKKIKKFEELADGSIISIPNDPSNEARALRLLEKNGLITLKEGDMVTVRDIISNPKNIKFLEIEAPQLPRSLQDVTASVINTNFAAEAGLIPSKDALIIEDSDSPYANIVAVRGADKDSPKTKVLVKAINSPEVKAFIEENLVEKGIVPGF